MNDGSTDATPTIADEYARRDPRIRVVHKANGGVATALNTGLASARGKWVHWLSSDDLFTPEKLSINRRAIAQHPDCRFFFSYFQLLRQSTGELTNHGLWGPLPDRSEQIPTLFYRNYVSGITICVEREAWLSVGMFDPVLRYAQDYDMWLRLFSRFPGEFIPEWTVTSRNHAEQGSETFPQACYYDTAKSGILHLARASMHQLFPLLDLSRADHARQAIDTILNTSARDDSFIYAMGWHPCLLLRVVELVLEIRTRDARLGRKLSALVLWRCRTNIRRIGPEAAGLPWKIAFAALSIPGMELGNVSVDPEDIGVSRYYQMLSTHDAQTVAMREYLERFHGLMSLPRGRQGLAPPADVAIDVEGGEQAIHEVMPGKLAGAHEAVVRRGWRPMLLAEGKPSLSMHKGFPVLTAPAPALERIRKLFAFRLAVSATERQPSFTPHVFSFRLDHLEDIGDGVEGFLNLLRWSRGHERTLADPTLFDRISVDFVIHSIIGGGAERATANLAAALAAQGWRIRIITQDERVLPGLPGVEFVSLRKRARELFEKQQSANSAYAAAAPLAPMAMPLPSPSPEQAPLDRSQRAWRKLTPETRAFILHLPGMRRVAGYAKRAWRGVRKVRAKLSTMLRRSSVSSPATVAPASAPLPVVLALPAFDADPKMATMHEALYPHTETAALLAGVIAETGRDGHVVAVMEGMTVSAWVASVLAGKKFNSWLHTLESQYLPQLYSDPKRLHAELGLFATATRNAHRVVFPTKACADDLASMFKIPCEEVISIWNPVDVDETRRLAKLGSTEPAGGPLFVSVARLSEEKNHGLLLDAFELLLKRHPNARCRIIGEGGLRQSIEHSISRRGIGASVKLMGQLENPFSEIAAADALVLTSKFESFALVLVEAMALGVPAISVDCPTGPREVLDQVGILTPQGDAEALADAMARVIEDKALKQRLAGAGPDRAQLFDCVHAAVRWEKLFDGEIMQTR